MKFERSCTMYFLYLLRRIDHSNDILFYCEDSSDDDEDTIQLEMFEVQHQLWMFEDSSESDVEE